MCYDHTKILKQTIQEVELFHTPDGQVFATFMNNDHRETWPVRSDEFRAWLSNAYYGRASDLLSNKTLNDTLITLEGKGKFESPTLPIFTRIAEHEGNIYFNLANKAWEVVEITKKNWEVIPNPPVKFRCARGMLPLPAPQKKGSLNVLRSLLNIRADSVWESLVSWLIDAIHLRGPYSILCVQDVGGSAQPFICKLIRSVIDPFIAPVRFRPKELKDLMISAKHSHVLCYDLFSPPSWFSNALRRLSAGAGLSVKENYSDDQEVLFEAARPIILTGRRGFVDQCSLRDQSVIVTLPTVNSNRLSEKNLLEAFKKIHPSVLGALFDAISASSHKFSRTKISQPSQTPDFATRIVAAEGGLSKVLEDEIRNFVVKQITWEGTSSTLLEELRRGTKGKLPETASIFSKELKSITPFLHSIGIEVVFGSSGSGRRKKRSIRVNGANYLANFSQSRVVSLKFSNMN